MVMLPLQGSSAPSGISACAGVNFRECLAFGLKVAAVYELGGWGEGGGEKWVYREYRVKGYFRIEVRYEGPE